MKRRCRSWLAWVALTQLVCGCDETGNERSYEVVDAKISLEDGKTSPDFSSPPGWAVAFRETFDNVSIDRPSWQQDTYPDDGPFSDDGAYFQNRGIELPTGYRATRPFGTQDWLTIESYSRNDATRINDLITVVNDPAGGDNKVFKISSPAHTEKPNPVESALLPSSPSRIFSDRRLTHLLAFRPENIRSAAMPRPP